MSTLPQHLLESNDIIALQISFTEASPESDRRRFDLGFAKPHPVLSPSRSLQLRTFSSKLTSEVCDFKAMSAH